MTQHKNVATFRKRFFRKLLKSICRSLHLLLYIYYVELVQRCVFCVMGGGDTDESWEPPDDTEMNHCIDYPEDADYEPEEVEICSDKCRKTYSWRAEKFPPHATACSGDVAVPASRDAASFSCPTTVSAGSKRKLQGLHGKQATHFQTEFCGYGQKFLF
jgi:hypothetical protein